MVCPLARGGAWRHVSARVGSCRRVAARGGAWRRVAARAMQIYNVCNSHVTYD